MMSYTCLLFRLADQKFWPLIGTIAGLVLLTTLALCCCLCCHFCWCVTMGSSTTNTCSLLSFSSPCAALGDPSKHGKIELYHIERCTDHNCIRNMELDAYQESDSYHLLDKTITAPASPQPIMVSPPLGTIHSPVYTRFRRKSTPNISVSKIKIDNRIHSLPNASIQPPNRRLNSGGSMESPNIGGIVIVSRVKLSARSGQTDSSDSDADHHNEDTRQSRDIWLRSIDDIGFSHHQSARRTAKARIIRVPFVRQRQVLGQDQTIQSGTIDSSLGMTATKSEAATEKHHTPASKVRMERITTGNNQTIINILPKRTDE